MIKKYVDRFTSKEDEVRKLIEKKLTKKSTLEKSTADYHRSYLDYEDLVEMTIKVIKETSKDPDRFGFLRLGAYQGDYVFFITNEDDYNVKLWTMKVAYGSCSGCDMIEDIEATYSSTSNLQEKITAYQGIMLNLVESLKELKVEEL